MDIKESLNKLLDELNVYPEKPVNDSIWNIMDNTVIEYLQPILSSDMIANGIKKISDLGRVDKTSLEILLANVNDDYTYIIPLVIHYLNYDIDRFFILLIYEALCRIIPDNEKNMIPIKMSLDVYSDKLDKVCILLYDMYVLYYTDDGDIERLELNEIAEYESPINRELIDMLRLYKLKNESGLKDENINEPESETKLYSRSVQPEPNSSLYQFLKSNLNDIAKKVSE